MNGDTHYAGQIFEAGYAIVEGVISSEVVAKLCSSFSCLSEAEEVRRRTSIYGVRNLLSVSEEVRQLAASPSIRSLVVPLLGPNCFAARATFFDKVPAANWNLGWHQDGVISVRERVDTPGYSAWSQKAGAMQVRPPEAVMQQMLAIRVHLDDCPQTNGALRILVGSHHQQWTPEEIANCKSIFQEVSCEVSKGGVLVMRPLLLHASSASESPGHRRVIHIEYAHEELPGKLDWHQRVA